MFDRKGFGKLDLIISLLLVGFLTAMIWPGVINQQRRTRLMDNMEYVQHMVEDAAFKNRGIFPASAEEVSEIIPGLKNPYTSETTTKIVAGIPNQPGEIGYQVTLDQNGVPRDYIVFGFAKDRLMRTELTHQTYIDS